AGADRPRASGERGDDRLGQRRQVDTEDTDQPRESDTDSRGDESAEHGPPRVRGLGGSARSGRGGGGDGAVTVHGVGSFRKFGRCVKMYSRIDAGSSGG